MHDCDHAEPTAGVDVGPLLAPVEVRPEGAEEPAVAITDRQGLVQGQDALGVGGGGGAHLHARPIRQFDDLGGVDDVHAPPFCRLRARPRRSVYPSGYHETMTITRGFIAGVAGVSLLLASCGSDDPASDGADTSVEVATADGAAEISGISTVSVDEAAAIADNPPDDLVVLDVRTPEEYAEGHLEDAVLVDFYDADFVDQLAALDPDVPYLVYCRSGNRSGETLAAMEQLGFSSVVDVDGGIVAWTGAGLPVTND